MFQTSDSTILGNLTEICAVVDFEFRYIYIDGTAANDEQIPRDKLLGRSILKAHPDIEIDTFIRQLRTCMREHKAVEFKDSLGKWKIRLEPVPEGAFIHMTRPPVEKTKVHVNRKKESALLGSDVLQHSIKEQSKVLDMEGWLDALDFRTRESNDHILRVTDATVLLAKAAGIAESEIPAIRHGALLHDIGKTGIPDAILLKTAQLTDEEWEVVRKHPIYAHDLFYPVDYLRDCLPIPYSHHEKWDGTGYPLRLKGDDIPLAARLFAVVDVWDTLSHDRVYGKAWPRDEVMQYIEGQSGLHFDPQAVDLFFEVNKHPAKYSIR